MIKESILRDILNEYSLLRAQQEQSVLERELLIYKKIPEIAKLRHFIIDLMAQMSKEIVRNPEKAIQNTHELEQTVLELKAVENRLLLEHGFSAEYLMPDYRCPKCKDTGYTGGLVREKCSCLSQQLLARIYQLSEISELNSQNFDTFDPSVFPETLLESSKLGQREYMLQLKERLQDYANEFPDNDRKSLLFSGKTGLGKTFLLNCMSKVIMEKGFIVIRISAYNLFNRLFSGAFQGQEENRYLFSRLYDSDLLIIDDLGTETQRNNFTSEDLFNIINERFLKNKHTFLSTNLGLPELRERYSDRITSRLFDTTNTMLIKFMGQDIRLRYRK